MAAILNSDMMDSDTAILDSDTLLFSLTFIEKHSHSTLTLTQTNSFWLKPIHFHSMWWWQPSWIMPSWIQQFCTIKLYSFILTWLDDGSHLEFWHVGFRHCHLGFRHLVIFSQIHSKTLSLHSDSIWLQLIHSHSMWWWQPSWIMPSWIQQFCTIKLYSFILTWLDDGSHLEFCHVGFRHCHHGFRHLVIFTQIHSKTPTPLSLWLKLIQSD